MKKKKIISLLMIMLVAVFAFAGCSSSSDESSSTDTSASSESENTTSTSTDKDSSIMIGEITAINDGEMTLSLYDSDSIETDVTDIDTSELKSSGESETVDIQEDAKVERISDGVTQTAAVDSLAVGDMVAISDEDGQLIAILDMDNTTSDSTTGTTSTDSDTMTDTDTSSDASTTTSSSTSTGSSDTTSTSGSSENTVTVD